MIETMSHTMTTKHDIDAAIQQNLQLFKKAGALTVRPGYKITGGWITPKPAIVVTVRKKKTSVATAQRIPPKVGGFPTDVRQATVWQKLRQDNPQSYASLQTSGREEYAQPEFPYERDAQTGQLLAATTPHPALAAHKAKPVVPYSPPSNANLEPVTDTMSITFCASPDAGWLALSKFLTGIQNRLTVGMYDFTSAHVLAAVESGLDSGQPLSLVLDHPAPNKSADQSDEQTQADLAKQLRKPKQFAFAWAAEAMDPKVSSAIFPNAYHIKVAVKDGQSFWLSSGNWNNSNQPDINPFVPDADRSQIDPIAKKSDRDWHAIVEHAGLAKTFEAYLENDLAAASKLQAGKAGLALAASLPHEASAESPEAPIAAAAAPARYFEPFQILNEKVKVQPVLTPDAGAGNYVQNFLGLIDSAKQKLYIQTQYIHPADPNKYPGLQALFEAVKGRIDAKVDVRIICSQYEATGAWLEKLQDAGIDVPATVRIQPGVHNKGFVVDTKIVALGSQNWSGDGVERNRDASLIVYHAGAAAYFEKIFLSDWARLKPRLTTGA
jgi:phosphatidylserine/phosphatidylglycerophosphate/cardiolipin synthase-like enzyme